MSLTNNIKNTLAGIVLSLAVGLGGGCREPVDKTLNNFKIKQCSVEATLNTFLIDPVKLIPDKSKFMWENGKCLLFRNTTFDYYAPFQSPNKYIGENGGNLEAVIIGPQSWDIPVPQSVALPFFLVFNNNSSLIVAPCHQSSGWYRTESDSINSRLFGSAIKFDAVYNSIIQDDKIIATASLHSNVEKLLFLLDLNDNFSSGASLSVNKIIISPELAGASSEYLAHNNDWIVYKTTKVSGSNSTAQQLTQEGIYVYNVNTNTTTYISVEGKDDKLLSLLDDIVLMQKSNGEIWAVYLGDFLKYQEANAGDNLFLVSFQDKQINGWTSHNKTVHKSFLYRNPDDSIIWRTIGDWRPNFIPNTEKSSPWEDIGLTLHNPQVFKINEYLSTATFVLKEGAVAKLLSIDSFYVPQLGTTITDISSKMPQNNFKITSFVKGTDPRYFHTISDENKTLVISPFYKGRGSQIYNTPIFVLPNFILDPDGNSLERVYTNKKELKIEEFLNNLSSQNNLKIKQSFFADNSLWLEANFPEAQQLYINMNDMTVFRIDGNYSSNNYEVEDVIETSPPLFLLQDKENSTHKILVKPE